jgi:hypothetical protein
MTDQEALLTSWITLGALWLFVHALLLARCLRARGLSPWLRLLALVPIATPIIAWRRGSRLLAGVWLAVGLLYAWLRHLS